MEFIDEEEILEFLKSSIDFRIQYCHWSVEILPISSPIPHPELTTTPMTTPGKTASGSTAKTTTVKSTAKASKAVSSSSGPASPFTKATKRKQQAEADVSSEEVPADDVASVLKEVALDNALSSISQMDEKSVSSMDKPSRTWVVNNDPAGRQLKRMLKKIDDVANPA